MALKLDFVPGTRWKYSNTGYMLLGFVIEKVTGRTYGELLRDRIFKPTGMKTARIISNADIVRHRAAGYKLAKNELKNQDWVSRILNTTADGCHYWSLADCVAWEKVWRSRTLLKPESWAQMIAPVKLKSGRPYPYGFGIFVDTVRGQRIEQHSGTWQGFKAYRAYGRPAVFALLRPSALEGAIRAVHLRGGAALGCALNIAAHELQVAKHQHTAGEDENPRDAGEDAIESHFPFQQSREQNASPAGSRGDGVHDAHAGRTILRRHDFTLGRVIVRLAESAQE